MPKHTRIDIGVQGGLAALKATLHWVKAGCLGFLSGKAGPARPQPDAAQILAPDPGAMSWRYRMLLLAAGATSPDGSDLTPSDRQVLGLIERRLAHTAAVQGAEAAERALLEIVAVLETGATPDIAATRH